MNPADLKYSAAHTWVKAQGGEVTIGLTQYAQEQLGNILFIELKDVGDRVSQSEPCGTVESDKAAADIVTPVSGEVVAVNEEVLGAPEKVNEDPYGTWLVRLLVSDASEVAALLSADQYEAHIASLG